MHQLLSDDEGLLRQIHSCSRLGRALRSARTNAGYTQAQLAEKTGCSVRTVWMSESGCGRADVFISLTAGLGMEIAGRSLPTGDGIGARLKALRSRMGLSRRVVAAASKTSPTTIAELERERLGHLAVLERIAETLGAGLTLVACGKATFFGVAATSSASDNWSTPQEVLDRLYLVVGGAFCLDPCSARRGRGRVDARVHLNFDDDGLSFEWPGKAVYMNPPYGRHIGAWTAKALQEVEVGRAGLIVGLLPARTDTRWWHSSVAGRADVWMLRGRVAFGTGENSAPFPSALALWGGQAIHRSRMTRAFPDAWHVPGLERHADQASG